MYTIPHPAILWRWVSLYSMLHIVIFLGVAFHCLRTRRNAPSAILWMFLAWSFPIIGAVCYLAFGINRIPTKGWLKDQADQEMRAKRDVCLADDAPPSVYWRGIQRAETPPLGPLFASNLNAVMDALLADYPALDGNRVELLVDGDAAYPRMLEAIRGARHHIHLQSFIIHNDIAGREFMDALAEKARRGVPVRVLYDRLGSTYGVLSGFFRRYRKVPNMHVVGWTQANPIKRLFQVNLRNHRKILVVDGRMAFCGGVNISAYNLSSPDPLKVHDYHFAIAGPVVQELQYSFLRDWHFMTDASADQLLIPEHFPPLDPAGNALVRVVNSGPTTSELGVVADIFFSAIASARTHLLILTPYFVPGDEIMQALRSAALRGVRIQLVVPLKNNHPVAGLAGRALYDDLLKVGVEIYERRPPFIHAKALIMDNAMALVGTANFDCRSLRLSYETNLAVFEAEFIQELGQSIAGEIEESDRLERGAWRQRPLSYRMVENFCNLMTPIL